MSLTLEHPYSDVPMPWYRGNLHTHTTDSDGDRAPQAVVNAYASRNYDFLALSDHDQLTPVANLDSKGVTLIPSNEVTASGPHILHIGAATVVSPDPNRQSVLSDIHKDGGLAIACHPNWESNFDHCPQTDLEQWERICGIEIYNGVARRSEGSPRATDRWDQLLGAGRRVWGFANDDSHEERDDGIAWNVVQAPTRGANDVLDALRKGRFYASSGVTIRNVRVEGSTITVETDDAERIAVVADYGRRVYSVEVNRIEYTVPEDTAYQYVRFACFGRGESMAWTQPFFISKK